MSVEVDVQIALEADDLPADESLRQWARAAAVGETDDAELTVRLVDDAEGRALNETYRAGKGPTNVLAFPCDLGDAAWPPLLGDVVICVPVVRREAEEQGKTLAAHLAHMTVHGTLHLLGYDHLEDEEAAVMETREREVLAGLGHPDPYRSPEDEEDEESPTSADGAGGGRQ